MIGQICKGQSNRRNINFVDLFAGVGGFTLGFMDNSSDSKCRFVPRLLVDVDNTARQVFVRNMPNVPYLCADIHQLTGNEIATRAGLRTDERLDLLIGGPPCQGFSFLGKRALDDKRNLHVLDYLRLVKELRPLIAVMENVPLVITNYDGAVIKEVCDALAEFGYASCADILTANEFGVPQIRKRAFVLAYHRDLNVAPEFPKRTYERVPSTADLDLVDTRPRFEPNKLAYVSVEDAIGDLPPLRSSEGDDLMMYPNLQRPLTDYQKWARQGSIAVFNHRSRTHSASYLKKISVIREGGRNMDLPDGQRFSDNYFSQAYARLHRSGLATTITTSFGNPGSGRFIHYRDLRSITVREAARLQSFPDRFVFDGESTVQMRHVGNAVPPLLARAIRNQISQDISLSGENKRDTTVTPVPPSRELSARRSRIMRAPPSKKTPTEKTFRKILSDAGIRGYRLNCRGVPGCPDVVFNQNRVAVFVDACIWHGCPTCCRQSDLAQLYRKLRVQRNRERDLSVTKQCRDAGWKVIRIWEHQVNRSPHAVVTRINKALNRAKGKSVKRRKAAGGA